MASWNFEADYFTACNCDWGCPCNFNARPTEGRCIGWGAWHIRRGKYGDTSLDGARLAMYYAFPGLVEQGNGTGCIYVDERASPAQRKALEAIGSGREGGGIFEIFGTQLVTRWLPTKVTKIDLELDAKGVGRVTIKGFGEGESELLSYPDGTVITPQVELPHGIEFKSGLMTNAARWLWRDEDLLATYANKYGAVAKVRFANEGCIG